MANENDFLLRLGADPEDQGEEFVSPEALAAASMQSPAPKQAKPLSFLQSVAKALFDEIPAPRAGLAPALALKTPGSSGLDVGLKALLGADVQEKDLQRSEEVAQRKHAIDLARLKILEQNSLKGTVPAKAGDPDAFELTMLDGSKQLRKMAPGAWDRFRIDMERKDRLLKDELDRKAKEDAEKLARDTAAKTAADAAEAKKAAEKLAEARRKEAAENAAAAIAGASGMLKNWSDYKQKKAAEQSSRKWDDLDIEDDPQSMVYAVQAIKTARGNKTLLSQISTEFPPAVFKKAFFQVYPKKEKR